MKKGVEQMEKGRGMTKVRSMAVKDVIYVENFSLVRVAQKKSSRKKSRPRHKLQIGVELFPPPPIRARDFMAQQIVRSLWESFMLFFMMFILFPFIFIATGIETIGVTIYTAVAASWLTVIHYITFCRSRKLQEKASEYQGKFLNILKNYRDLRLWLGTAFPALSHYIGTRHVDSEEFSAMSSAYRWLRDSQWLQRYDQR